MKHRAILILGFFATMAGPTLAGPREDTLSGISRCSAIADDRTFLDCIYGAAQPLRARLGLPPAPPFQTQLVPRTVPATVSPVPAGAPIAAAPATSPAKRNGLLGGLFGSDDAHALTMVSYTFDSHGMFTVTLSNGEVWRQRQNDTNYADLRGPASHYVVSLVDNGSGDAKMDVKGEGGPYAVQRLR